MAWPRVISPGSTARHGRRYVIIPATQPVRPVVTDIVMPNISGVALAAALRATHPTLLVLFMSGHSGDELEERHLLGRHETFVQKPFETDDLVRHVHDMLRRQPAPHG